MTNLDSILKSTDITWTTKVRLVKALASPVAYWASTNLGSSSYSVLSFCLFILFMGFSRQEYWSGLPFPSPAPQFESVYSLALSFLYGPTLTNKDL